MFHGIASIMRILKKYRIQGYIQLSTYYLVDRIHFSKYYKKHKTSILNIQVGIFYILGSHRPQKFHLGKLMSNIRLKLSIFLRSKMYIKIVNLCMFYSMTDS